MSVMCADNLINGEKCAENHNLIKTILRDYWGFSGYTMCDCGGFWSTEQALGSELDFSEGTDLYIKELPELIEEGVIDIQQVDNAVRNVLRVKSWPVGYTVQARVVLKVYGAVPFSGGYPMRSALIARTALVLFVVGGIAAVGEAAISNSDWSAGIGIVDITPSEPVVLAGSPAQLKSSSVGSRLYVKALVLSCKEQEVAIVTLDTLKYPVDHVVSARRRIERATGIPAGNVIICASHTHRGPLWSYYPDQLVTSIAQAVEIAVRDLVPCRLGIAMGKVEGVSECRRVIRDGNTWNRWQLAASVADQCQAESPIDPELDLLAVIGSDGKYRAVVYNFACHAANTRDLTVSSDYPGDVQRYVQKQLVYEVPLLFLAGACGDVNPVYRASEEMMGEKLGERIIQCLGQLEPIDEPSFSVESRELPMPGREHPEFKEAEIARNWPSQLEHYRKSFHDMMRRKEPTYQCFFTGIRIGDDFAIVTNPSELFCEIGMGIRSQSPFRYTMVVELTNGAHGYVPTAKAFEAGSYETWFGEHSFLTTRAGEIIEKESLAILNYLKQAE